MNEESRHRLEGDVHAQEMIRLLERIHAKQHEWEENQRWQVNQMRQTLSSLHRDVSFGLLLLLILLGYIIYRHYW